MTGAFIRLGREMLQLRSKHNSKKNQSVNPVTVYVKTLVDFTRNSYPATGYSRRYIKDVFKDSIIAPLLSVTLAFHFDDLRRDIVRLCTAQTKRARTSEL
ncbi:hypothetical protein LSAT2_022090, partial [Lamellibrachia satsuma]